MLEYLVYVETDTNVSHRCDILLVPHFSDTVTVQRHGKLDVHDKRSDTKSVLPPVEK